MSKKAVMLSCFQYYNHRIKYVEDVLKKQGYDTVYITADFDSINKKKSSSEGDIVIPTRPYYKNLSFDRIYSHIKFAEDAFKEVSKQKPDLIYAMVPPNSVAKEAAAYKKKHPETKLVFDIYDLWPETFPSNKLKKLLTLPFAVWGGLRDRALSSADLIMTECDMYRDVLGKKLSGLNVSTLHLCRAASAEKGEPSVPTGEAMELCYLGSINNIIDIDTICELIREMAKIRPIKLNIIGDGESREEFVSAAEKTGAEVEYYGRVYDAEEKQKIFDRSSFGINMMKSSVCVGLTMKSLDYFAAGLPILNTIAGDTKKLTEERKIGINVCREDIKKTALAATGISQEDSLRMRKETLRVFEEYFAEEICLETLNGEISKL